MRNFLFHSGRYVVFILKAFAKPEKSSPYFKQLLNELNKLGMSSIGITVVISAFMGAVITIQTAFNMTAAYIPKYIIGLGTRDSMLLEFSSTMIALILAGKAGSNIASEIGTMKITEQIDALEIMGVNSVGYLVLPKLIAALIFFPLLTVMSMIVGIFGGYLATFVLENVTQGEFVNGLHTLFNPFYIVYSLIKMTVFAFIISSISSYQGYYVEGGAVAVGRASVKAVVYSDFFILLANVIITKLLLG